MNTSVVHTGQLFFTDSFSDAIYTLTPYSTSTVSRTALASDGIYSGTTNANAGLFDDPELLQPSVGYSGGLLGTLTLAIDPTATGNDGDIGMPGGGGGRPGSSPSPSASPASSENASDGDYGSVLGSVLLIGCSLVGFAGIIGGLLYLKLRGERAGYESL
jgi:hypothetical protein